MYLIYQLVISSCTIWKTAKKKCFMSKSHENNKTPRNQYSHIYTKCIQSCATSFVIINHWLN